MPKAPSSAALRGNYATLIAHNPETKRSRMKLPQRSQEDCAVRLSGYDCRGGRIDKPIMKAAGPTGSFKVKRNCWPKVRGVCMNRWTIRSAAATTSTSANASTIRRDTSAGRKVGLIAARRTGAPRHQGGHRQGPERVKKILFAVLTVVYAGCLFVRRAVFGWTNEQKLNLLSAK
uniref:60S ribosomal protein L8 n=1 Tax=Macrostomum lignano TaxID=282301 RepID=A0A1I8FAY7_9PLAT